MRATPRTIVIAAVAALCLGAGAVVMSGMAAPSRTEVPPIVLPGVTPSAPAGPDREPRATEQPTPETPQPSSPPPAQPSPAPPPAAEPLPDPPLADPPPPPP
ncbi:MAG: hypothetical protein H0V05_20095, partial [Euzebyaceae bacterium]|nr:hypothetical protein [Euzebyaceae bacterium]